MKVEGDRDFSAPRATVWEVLNDPERMAKTMPGVESFDVHDERHWTANVKIPLGLGGLRMTVNMEKVEEREPEFAKMAIKGNGVGAIMNMETLFHLSEAEAGTRMHWEADVHLLGPVASMGQRVIQPIVNQQVSNVLTALDKQVHEAAAEPPVRERGPGEGAPGEPGGSPGGGARSDVHIGSQPGGGDALREGAQHAGSGAHSEGSGGDAAPTTDRDAPATDPEVKDAGPPADGVADPEGTSGAEEGVNPWAPEAYSDEPSGPTTSTHD
jgi:uncharacterized protein